MKKHLIIMALAAIAATPVVASSKPNILLFITDDHSVSHLGVYGDENCLKFNITPNIDSFAKEAISFDNAYVTAPHGAPSRVSIFTGLHPVVTGTTRYGQPPQPEIPLFTDILREGGYWVGLSGQDPHLSGDYRTDENSRLQEIYSELGIK